MDTINRQDSPGQGAELPVLYRGLDETEIKKAFIPFLRSFYKYRYEFRPETLQSSTDNVSGPGLVADGMMKFYTTDGKPFVCTYEASSLEKSAEVKYTLNVVYFIWDCLAFSALATAVAYAFLYKSRLPWLSGLHFIGNIGLLLGLAVIGFFLWYYTMRHWKKYRYIYAVEQFKRYFADEQWIALGEDVFPAPTDPYFLELRQQCVYNGFGLAIVSREGAVRAVVNPSRLGIYGRDRKMVEWITRNEWYQTMANNMAVVARNRPSVPGAAQINWNKLWRPLRYQVLEPVGNFFWRFLKEPLSNSNTAYERFMKGRTLQQYLVGLGLAGMLFVGYRVSDYRTEDYIDPASLLHQQRGPNPEDQPGYEIDGAPVPYSTPSGVPKQYPVKAPKKAPEEEIQVINLSGDE